MSFIFVLSNAGLSISILLWCLSQTSQVGRFSILIFLVNFFETPQEYVGILWIFANRFRVLVPILFATIFFVNASAPNRKISHFFIDSSAAKSGVMMTFIFAFAKSFAVVRPCNNGSTSEV